MSIENTRVLDSADPTRGLKVNADGSLRVESGSLQNGAETAVADTAVQLIAANADRKALIIQNVGSASMRVGVSGVTATTGIRVQPGGHVTFSAPTVTDAIFAIRDTATSTTALAQETT